MSYHSKFYPEDKGLLHTPTHVSKHTLNPFSDFSACLSELKNLQKLVQATRTHSVCALFQGMDTSGKDSVIRHVFAGLNPMALECHAFQEPTPQERRQDFLWRIHAKTPPLGCWGVWNRSHYEDLTTAKIWSLISAQTWENRLNSVLHFEEHLKKNNVILLKFFLHISKNEQEKRIEERKNTPKKHWKFAPSDERAKKDWDKFQDIWDKVIQKTHHSFAPWHIIPSDDKGPRNLAVAQCIAMQLSPYKKTWVAALENM